jgi:hypothetical protein
LGVVNLEAIGIAVRTEDDFVLVSVFFCCGNRVNEFFLTGSLDFNGREDDAFSDEVILTRIGATIAAAVAVEGEVLNLIFKNFLIISKFLLCFYCFCNTFEVK